MDGFGDVFRRACCDELRKLESFEDGCGGSCVGGDTFERDARDAHPTREKRCCEPVVGKGIQGDVDLRVPFEKLRALGSRELEDSRRIDPQIYEGSRDNVPGAPEIGEARIRAVTEDFGPCAKGFWSDLESFVGAAEGERLSSEVGCRGHLGSVAGRRENKRSVGEADSLLGVERVSRVGWVE